MKLALLRLLGGDLSDQQKRNMETDLQTTQSPFHVLREADLDRFAIRDEIDAPKPIIVSHFANFLNDISWDIYRY